MGGARVVGGALAWGETSGIRGGVTVNVTVQQLREERRQSSDNVGGQSLWTIDPSFVTEC